MSQNRRQAPRAEGLATEPGPATGGRLAAAAAGSGAGGRGGGGGMEGVGDGGDRVTDLVWRGAVLRRLALDIREVGL